MLHTKQKLVHADGAAKTRPVVMISYSHESKRHTKRVADLADRLREEAGCDCRLDLYDEHRVANWPQWMRKQIAEATHLLMVFTRTYRRRFDGDEATGRGRGVIWEGAIITNTLYAAAGGSTQVLKFIPCAFSKADLANVPRDIFSGSSYVLPNDWKRLINRIWGKATVPLPPIGRPPFSEIKPAAPAGSPSPYQPDRTLKILFVGAQKGTGLDLRGQLRMTKTAIEKAKFKQSVQFDGLFNITPDQMLMELNLRSPAVLHLSGKQEGGQVKMHNQHGELVPIAADRLSGLLGEFQHMLRLVVLDTCDSLPQAKKIVRTVDCAIGVAGAIAEPVAVDFFAMFYNSVANGSSVQHAYDLAFGLERAKIEGNGKYRREVEEILEKEFNAPLHLPRIVWKRGLNPNKIFLVH